MGELRQFDEAIEAAFGDLAVAKELATGEELSRCVALRVKDLESGKAVRLGEVMMREGIITKVQALTLLKEAHKAGGDRARIGGYELLDKLGEGAMGAVYRAKQLSMDRIVALKLLPQALSVDEVARQRFLREARIVARLNHPYIVRGYEVGESNGYNFFAMEFVDGGTTGHRMRHDGPFSEEEVIKVGLEMAEALSHAHDVGVVHRDIKPDNIMIGHESYKLADLGLATRVEEESSLTQAGCAVGTPYYMAPEQVEGWENLDHRLDIYALGASLYHLLTGCPPFEGTSVIAIMGARLREDAVPACSLHKGISRGLTSVLMKCMQRSRNDRYQDCNELIDDLKRVLEGEEPSCMALANGVEMKGRLALPTFGQGRGLAACTPVRMVLTAALMVVFTAVVWFARNFDDLRGPVHPLDSRIKWSGLPGPAKARGTEAADAWRETRQALLPVRKDQDAQITLLKDFLKRYPKSLHDPLARTLIYDFGGK